jgi:hypothetical protein
VPPLFLYPLVATHNKAHILGNWRMRVELTCSEYVANETRMIFIIFKLFAKASGWKVMCP